MKRRKTEKIPMDPELRAQALLVIEAYKTKSVTVESPYDELAPAMLNTFSDFIEKYDKNELNLTLQKSLIRLMKKLVAKYHV